MERTPSTKNPIYSDTKYIEPLIGLDTINSLPVETLEAYKARGHPSLTLEQQGVANFVSALERLVVALKEKQAAVQTVAVFP